MNTGTRQRVRLGKLLRSERVRMDWSLQGVQNLLVKRGRHLTASTNCRIEQGQIDVRARNLFSLLALYNVSPQVAADIFVRKQRKRAPNKKRR